MSLVAPFGAQHEAVGVIFDAILNVGQIAIQMQAITFGAASDAGVATQDDSDIMLLRQRCDGLSNFLQFVVIAGFAINQQCCDVSPPPWRPAIVPGRCPDRCAGGVTR